MMATTKDHEVASYSDSLGFSDWDADDTNLSDSEFDQARRLTYESSESDDSDYSADQCPNSANTNEFMIYDLQLETACQQRRMKPQV